MCCSGSCDDTVVSFKHFVPLFWAVIVTDYEEKSRLLLLLSRKQGPSFVKEHAVFIPTSSENCGHQK